MRQRRGLVQLGRVELGAFVDPARSRQGAFQMTVVKLPSEASTSTPSTPSCSDTTLSDMWASPTNATEPPLEVEAVPEGPREA